MKWKGREMNSKPPTLPKTGRMGQPKSQISYSIWTYWSGVIQPSPFVNREKRERCVHPPEANHAG
jgi:hypothetical protein